MLPSDFYSVRRGRDEFPAGLTASQQRALGKFVNQLVEKGFLREQ